MICGVDSTGFTGYYLWKYLGPKCPSVRELAVQCGYSSKHNINIKIDLVISTVLS